MLLYGEKKKKSERSEQSINVETSSYMEWKAAQRAQEEKTKKKIFSVLRLSSRLWLCFMGHKLLAFRLRTAFFEAFLLDYFH
jgi:hypothetical protein